VACIECDLVVTIGELQAGERAECPRCGFLLSRHIVDSYAKSMSYALAALVFLAIANAFPFLSFQRSGLESAMTLPSSVLELWRYDYPGLAVVVSCFIIVIPATYLAVLIGVLAPLSRNVPAPWLVGSGRALFLLAPWSMVEVFVIGVLVSLVKIASMATVVMGISFWAYLGFALSFTAALASFDRLEAWNRIEGLTHVQ
jgi:paraquat-inducible protein A